MKAELDALKEMRAGGFCGGFGGHGMGGRWWMFGQLWRERAGDDVWVTHRPGSS